MPNETLIECYFKSADLLKLCQTSKDIVINVTATYTPGKMPKITVSAAAYKKAAKSGKSAKAMPLGDGTGGSVPGCPAPCK
jgi:hypothetical protein